MGHGPSEESMGQWYGGVPGRGWFAPGPGDPMPERTEDEPPLVGTRVAFFHDHGGGPLWDEEGELPNDPTWLRRELGLSDVFIADLLAWVDVQDQRRPGPVSIAEEQREALLFQRLQHELKPGLVATRQL